MGYSHKPLVFLFLIIFSSYSSVTPFNLPRLGTLPKSTHRHQPPKTPNPSSSSSSSSSLSNFKTLYYNQTLDHFNYKPESYTTFKQKYIINSKYWRGVANSTAPILAYLGAEESLDEVFPIIGFLPNNAPRFKALLVYIEHRYYGESIPFGSIEDALKNASIRGYFNSAQALADYAQVLLHVKKQYSARNAPIIVVGGSYGGMLASWFRLKYPHIALGALASSAPVLYFDDITRQNGYYSIVTKDFKESSESCYETIRKSWGEIDKVASKPNGLSILSKLFNTCVKLKDSLELKDFLDSVYAESAQYNHPPSYPVNIICRAIDGHGNGASKRGEILAKIFAGVVAYMGNTSCQNMSAFILPTQSDGWKWQTCSEIVMPVGRGRNDTMFYPAPFDLNSYINTCKSLYGLVPQPHWITTYYGGHDFKLILNKFGSNIIFSNGLRDPYSSGGVLENISGSVVSIATINGSHCLDILWSKSSDPEWLIAQRRSEVEIIEGWIATYHSDLQAFKRNNNNHA